MRKRRPAFRIGDFGTRFELPSGGLARRALEMEHRAPLLEFVRDLVLRTSPGWRRRLPDIVRNSEDLVGIVLRMAGARVFVDSSKVAHRLKFLVRVPSFNVKVIHLVRDGRAVALTYMNGYDLADAKDPALRTGGRGCAPEVGREMPIARAADEWRRCIRSAEFALAGLDSDRWLRVHYEELCLDPRGTLDRVFRFIEVEPERSVLDFRSVEHHILGNGMRLDSTSEIRLDERWKSTMTQTELRTFGSIAGETNKRYGYGQ